MGKECPLVTCMVVEVVGTVSWLLLQLLLALLALPGRLATVNMGLSASWGREENNSSRTRRKRKQVAYQTAAFEI